MAVDFPEAIGVSKKFGFYVDYNIRPANSDAITGTAYSTDKIGIAGATLTNTAAHGKMVGLSEISNGVATFSMSEDAATAPKNHTTSKISQAPYFVMVGTTNYINKVTLTFGEGNDKFPVGTVIKIYGVDK